VKNNYRFMIYGICGLLQIACGSGGSGSSSGGGGTDETHINFPINMNSPTAVDPSAQILRLLGTVKFEILFQGDTTAYTEQFQFSRSNLGSLPDDRLYLSTNSDEGTSYFCYIFNSGRFYCELEYSDGYLEMFAFTLDRNQQGQGEYVACMVSSTVEDCFAKLKSDADGTVEVEVTNANALLVPAIQQPLG